MPWLPCRHCRFLSRQLSSQLDRRRRQQTPPTTCLTSAQLPTGNVLDERLLRQPAAQAGGKEGAGLAPGHNAAQHAFGQHADGAVMHLQEGHEEW